VILTVLAIDGCLCLSTPLLSPAGQTPRRQRSSKRRGRASLPAPSVLRLLNQSPSVTRYFQEGVAEVNPSLAGVCVAPVFEHALQLFWTASPLGRAFGSAFQPVPRVALLQKL